MDEVRQDVGEPEGFYDDQGRYWPHDAEWCDYCQGMGTVDCECGGDFCVCGAYDSMECPRCQGEGYFVPTAAFKKARAETARWWRNLNAELNAAQSSPTLPEQLPEDGITIGGEG